MAFSGTRTMADMLGDMSEMPSAVWMMPARVVRTSPGEMAALTPRKIWNESAETHTHSMSAGSALPNLGTSIPSIRVEHVLSARDMPALLVSTSNLAMIDVPSSSKDADSCGSDQRKPGHRIAAQPCAESGGRAWWC